MVIQLADRSARWPRGIVEYVVIGMGEFIYFVVIEIEKGSNIASHVSVILGCLFLDTVNSPTSYRNGMMRLSFGNIILELNISNMQR